MYGFVNFYFKFNWKAALVLHLVIFFTLQSKQVRIIFVISVILLVVSSVCMVLYPIGDKWGFSKMGEKFHWGFVRIPP